MIKVQVDFRNFYQEFENKYEKSLFNNIEAAVNSTAIDAGNYARQNAPWNDITGEARRSTVSFVNKMGLIYEIIIGVGVSYGRFLELANGGKYRIIEPTRYHAEQVLNEMLTKTTYGS